MNNTGRHKKSAQVLNLLAENGEMGAPILLDSEQHMALRLDEATELLGLLARTTSHFITCTSEGIGAAIKQTLADIGQLFQVDRAYVFDVSADQSQVSNTHEWCAPGIEPQIEQLQKVPLAPLPWLVDELFGGRHVALADLAELPAHAVVEREMLQAQGIRSLLLVPMQWGTRLDGFVGFDHVRSQHAWSAAEITVLRIIANSIAQAFERKRREASAASLARLADHDPLTQLPNRALLAERLHDELERARRSRELTGICYLDLDGFKPVNDRLGHAAGDRLLVEVARRMLAGVRRGDTVARVGGDEFVVLLPALRDNADAIERVQRLRRAVMAPVELGDGVQVQVGVSAGLRVVVPGETETDTLLRQADKAMYAAKLRGDVGVEVFDPGEHA